MWKIQKTAQMTQMIHFTDATIYLTNVCTSFPIIKTDLHSVLNSNQSFQTHTIFLRNLRLRSNGA